MKIFIITQKYDPVFEKNLRAESKFILAVFAQNNTESSSARRAGLPIVQVPPGQWQ